MNRAASQSFTQWLIPAALILLTLAAYTPVWRNDFIKLDDKPYVTANLHVQQGLSWATVRWAFAAFEAGNWHPLTWLSHALDCQLYGLNPAGHHATSLLIHLGSVVLLYHLFLRLTGQPWPSGFVALLFAIHPMHVESVAWVAERKDQLSALFLFLTLLAYASYAQARQAQRPGLGYYVLAIVLYALGLLAKPMLVTVPCLLVLLDYWPLNRLPWPAPEKRGEGGRWRVEKTRWWLLEKIPFVLLAAVSCVVTVLAQREGNAIRDFSEFPLADRPGHALMAYAWYLGKLFWPVNLSVFYQLQPQVTSAAIFGAALLLLALTASALSQARRQPFLLVGWLWYLIMLLPVIGLVQVGNQNYADRYTYLPYLGLSIMLAWGARAFLLRRPRWMPAVGLLAVIAAASWLWLAREQLQLWRTPMTLFTRAVAVDPQSDEAWTLLAFEYADRQTNMTPAIDCLQRALAINPHAFIAWEDLGRFQVIHGDDAAAEAAFRRAIAEAPECGGPYRDLGDVLAKTGRYPEAIGAYQTSLALDPDHPEVHVSLGQCYGQARMFDQAIGELQAALTADPKNAQAELVLAGNFDQAGQPAQAAVHYRQALALAPDNPAAANNLAWWLATAPDPAQRDAAEAVRLAERACDQTRHREPVYIGTLAAAYAQAGRFDDAIHAAQQACALAAAAGQTNLVQRNQELLERYRAHLTAR